MAFIGVLNCLMLSDFVFCQLVKGLTVNIILLPKKLLRMYVLRVILLANIVIWPHHSNMLIPRTHGRIGKIVAFLTGFTCQ